MLVDIVSASANATPGLGRYPPFKREVVMLFTAHSVAFIIFVIAVPFLN